MTLDQLLAQPKFEPTQFYTGVDAPEDKPPLVAIVNSAISDVRAMATPRDPAKVRARLARIIDEVDEFATEDRDQAYRYAVECWRAAGFTAESRLFPRPDSFILRQP